MFYVLSLYEGQREWETIDWHCGETTLQSHIADEIELLKVNKKLKAWIVTDANGVILAHSEPIPF